MANFTAKDVQKLRQATGAGMLDAKRALEECAGEMEAATQWLREHGLAEKVKREDRDASQGAVAVVKDNDVAAIVELRCETDFVAKAAEFVAVADDLAALVAAKGEQAVAERSEDVERLATTLKENVSVGRVYRLEAKEGEVVDTYLHQQSGRGVNAVAVVVKGGSPKLAHEVALTAAFSRPTYVRREEVPEDEVEAERQTLEALSRNEGKPEAALPKIIEGRMNGWFKERVLLEQPSAHDDKQTVAAMLGSADIVAFAQVVIGP
ncbi:MAG TPA: translation elongation factor Ts [Acidimicrobiales bacterium]|nr:translation elongation factor Ts [Acidimicrobiales bacterium]